MPQHWTRVCGTAGLRFASRTLSLEYKRVCARLHIDGVACVDGVRKIVVAGWVGVGREVSRADTLETRSLSNRRFAECYRANDT